MAAPRPHCFRYKIPTLLWLAQIVDELVRAIFGRFPHTVLQFEVGAPALLQHTMAKNQPR